MVPCPWSDSYTRVPFGEAVSDARRTVDIDPNKSIIADIMKLVGSSSYGKAVRRALN